MKRVYSTEENLPPRKKAKEKDRGNTSVLVQWYVKKLLSSTIFQIHFLLQYLFRSINRSIERSIQVISDISSTGY